MNIKIGEVSHPVETWLSTHNQEWSDLEKKAIGIVRNWTNNEPYYYLTTSGSTGQPKAITLSRELLIWSAKNTCDYLELKDEKIGCCLPLNKAGGFMMLIRSLIYQCDIHIVAPTANPILFLDKDCTFVSLVPYQMIEILKEETSKAAVNNIKKILLGGAEIPLNLQKQLELLTTAVYFGYGMTETASHIALMHLNRGEANIGFELLPGVKIDILPTKQIAVSIPDFGLNWVTNDLGEMNNGRLLILGRTENYINSGGVKVLAKEVETIIEAYLSEKDWAVLFVVVGLQHPIFGEAISVVSENLALPQDARDEINNEIENQLGAKYKIVNWKSVEQFPLVNHKIDKQKLKQLLGEVQG
jgi:o-succinylbenzoate---CoA ligase